MDSAKSLGQAERVMGFSSDKKIVINEKNLKKIFEHPDVKNRKIVAFSVIGAYRKGKSFFLDYCLRFLYANVSCYLKISPEDQINIIVISVSIYKLSMQPYFES